MSSVIVCLGYTGSSIGIIQGVIWTILSICAICIRYELWTPQPSEATHAGIVCRAILDAYVHGNRARPFEGAIVTRDVFKYWLFFYLVVSVAWIVLSMWLFYAFLRKKKRLYRTICVTWAGCTCLVSLSDLILAILLGVDYKRAVESAKSESHVGDILATAIMMSLAARGFTLWLANVMVSIALAVLQCREKDEISDILRQHIHAYEANSELRRGKDNYGFDWKSEKDNASPDSNDETLSAQSLPRVDPVQTTNEHLAKIGKARGTATPTSVLSPKPPRDFLHPRVPSPDYSPIVSRKNTEPKKSALKIRTQNVYGTQF